MIHFWDLALQTDERAEQNLLDNSHYAGVQ